tara:strand:- start:45 stop:665 length:621 start_codon:yes stop_codon:yes gene_type:complete
LNINKNKILFVILAGGESKRFGGGFKTFYKINNKSIFERILKILKKNKIEIVINANKNHEQFKKFNLPIIKDKKKGFLGPLAGIHSSIDWCLNKYQTKEWVFTVPSDTPFLPDNLLNHFCNKLNQNVQILVARSNKKVHPVVSMWNVNLLKSLEKELNQNNRKIMNLVEKHNFNFVDFDFEIVDPFFNINTVEDLKIAKNFDQLNA